MSPEEALERIINSSPKDQLWCVVAEDPKEEIWLRVVAHRIRKGTAQRGTMKKFFAIFGYSYNEVVNEINP